MISDIYYCLFENYSFIPQFFQNRSIYFGLAHTGREIDLSSDKPVAIGGGTPVVLAIASTCQGHRNDRVI